MRNHLAGREAAADDLAYYRRRAEDERELAYGSEDHEIAAIHAKLARQYQILIARLEALSPSARTAWLLANQERSLWHTDWTS